MSQKPKTNKKTKNKKNKGPKEEPEPNDELMLDDGETLEKKRKQLREQLVQAKIDRNMLQLENDMIKDFYTNTRDEIKELDARVKNFDSDM